MDTRDSGGFEVVVDELLCVGAGRCVMAAPEVFDQGEDDGIVRLLQARPAPALEAAVEKAVRLCPARAIGIQRG